MATILPENLTLFWLGVVLLSLLVVLLAAKRTKNIGQTILKFMVIPGIFFIFIPVYEATGTLERLNGFHLNTIDIILLLAPLFLFILAVREANKKIRK